VKAPLILAFLSSWFDKYFPEITDFEICTLPNQWANHVKRDDKKENKGK